MEYSQILKDLRRESISVLNRLQSIIYDSKYVSEYLEFPLVVNERCGPWYAEPCKTTDSVYFKSTDGHTGEWQFSLRRLNLNLLDHFQACDVVVLVDSTRKGKLMPDALLKTVPIWCAVINCILFEGCEVPGQFASLAKDNWLLTPREMVSASEHHEIVARIPSFVKEVKKLGLFTKETIHAKLGAIRPLICEWRYPFGSNQTLNAASDRYVLCCLTASLKVESGTRVPHWSFPLPYVQGAADDHELWALGHICGGQFNHAFFWDHVYYEPSEELRVIDMGTGDISAWLTEEELIKRINGVYAQLKGSERNNPLDASHLGNTGIVIGSIDRDISMTEVLEFDNAIKQVIVISNHYSLIEIPSQFNKQVHPMPLESSKKGSKELRETLPGVLSKLSPVSPEKKILILCDTGKDLSVAASLCILCRSFDQQWGLAANPPHVNKDILKQHLSRILEHRKVNPSRNTLQSVNTILMNSRS